MITRLLMLPGFGRSFAMKAKTLTARIAPKPKTERKRFLHNFQFLFFGSFKTEKERFLGNSFIEKIQTSIFIVYHDLYEKRRRVPSLSVLSSRFLPARFCAQFREKNLEYLA